MARRVDPGRERVLLELIGSGMTPNRAAGIAGVGVATAYGIDRRVNGGGRLAAKRAGMAARAADRAVRPDRRKVDPERERALLGLVAAGMTANKAAGVAGVSPSWAYGLVKKIGGVDHAAAPGAPRSDRYLSLEERYEAARLLESGLSVRKAAARMGRAPSTISRELRRNASPRTGGYHPHEAHRLARQRQARPKPSKVSGSPGLRAAVQGMLDRRYSPEQAAGRLKVLHPDDPSMRVSHEAIYQSIYLYPRGELRKELKASLRRGRDARRPRGRREGRGKIIGAVPVGQRPPEAEGRLVPGHHEGDLVMGSQKSNSAVATIVERMSGYLTLAGLPDGHGADAVADAVIAKMTALPPWFARTLTWDNGKEMARHARITAATGINVYFADPYSPWQRGSNENTNGLLREYLPKGTDLSRYTPQQLQAIQDELNDRPRKRLGYRTPREEFDRLLAEDQRVATTP
jgi:transposase, IS30 family